MRETTQRVWVHDDDDVQGLDESLLDDTTVDFREGRTLPADTPTDSPAPAPDTPRCS